MADIKLDVSRVVGNLSTFAKTFAADDVADVLYEQVQIIAAESQKLTPVDTGALRASHTVSDPKISTDDISVTIGVGGPSAYYAVYVHEDMTAHHEVGQAKFLQAAISKYVRILPAMIGRALSIRMSRRGSS